MKDEIVYPKKGRADPSIGPVAIMVAMEKDLALIRRSLAVRGKTPWKILTSRLYQGSGDYQDVAIVGPLCGAPYAVMVLEKLIVVGARKILFFGWCGSIQKGLRLGDLLLPDSVISEEGTSAHYPVITPPRPSGLVFKAIEESLVASSLPFRTGAVWSTDAPYRETREKVISYQKQGVLGVEMELSALFTVASFRKIDMGALLVVSDELSSLRWKPGFSNTKFNSSRKIAAEIVCTACHRLSTQHP
jgi:uridine phosphorylase